MKNNCFRFCILSLFTLFVIHLKAQEVNDSIDTYSNQTVSTTASIQGRTTLSISNVNITSTGHLIVSSPDGIEISGPFEVSLGGQLDLYQYLTRFIDIDYDASGNIIRRHERLQAR